MQSKGKTYLKKFSPNKLLKEKYNIEVDDTTFCIMPFIHTSTTTNGEYRLCCRSKKISTVDTMGLKDLWNHTKYKTVRRNLIVGVRDSHCEACWKMEDKGITSLRQTQNFERLEEYSHLIKYWDEYKITADIIPIVEFKLSNLCNLKCRMCWPKDSTPWIQDWPAVQHLYDAKESEYVNTIIEKNNLYSKPIMNLFESNQQFVDDLDTYLPNITEFEFAGGEPIMDPLHYKIIEKIPNPENVILKYSTNLTSLEPKKGRNIIDIWRKFKAIRLTISIDGYDELNSYIRSGSDWATIVENIRIVKLALGDKLDYIKASTTISALNVEYLVETLEAVSKDMDIMWHTSRLQWPSFLSASVLPVDRLLDAKLKILNKLGEYQDETSIVDINNKRHLLDCLQWVEFSIENNTHDTEYSKYLEFNQILDQRRKEKFVGR